MIRSTNEALPFSLSRFILRAALVLGVVAATPLSGQSSTSTDTLRADRVGDSALVAPVMVFVPPAVGFRREWLSSSTPVRVLLGAGSDQWRGVPGPWPRTIGGFSARAGVRLAELSAQLGTLYGTAALLRQDPTYRPLHQGSVVRRTGHAVLGSVTAYKADGQRVFAPGTLTGAVASAAVAKLLLPGTTMRDEVRSRGTSMLTNRVVRSLWIEFLSPVSPPRAPLAPATRRPTVNDSSLTP